MRSFGAAIGELSTAQKSRRGVSLYSRFVNRPLGRVLAAGCYVIGLAPNQVTACSAVVTGTGLAVIVTGPPGPARAVLAAALLVLGFALDSADGQVSRLTGRSSSAGEWLDHVVDAGKMVAVHAAVLVMMYRYVDVSAWVFFLPLGFQLVSVVTFSGGVLVELLKRASPGVPPAPRRDPSPIRALGLLPADYGILAVSFVLLGWPAVFLGVYAGLLACNLIIMVMLLVKWFRELDRPSQQGAPGPARSADPLSDEE